jgi:hypothetical protein
MFGSLAISARAGNVRTRDGQDHAGDIDFQGADALSVTATDGSKTQIALADVAVADLSNAPTTAPADAPTVAWKGTDIGEVSIPGSDQFDEKSETATLNASGFGYLGTEDSLHLVYRSFHGDGEIIAHIATPMGPPKVPANPAGNAVPATQPSATDIVPGVTFRQNLDPASPHVSITAWMLNADVKLKYRPEAGALSVGDPFTALGDNGNNSGGPPRPWIRLARKGNLFSGYASVDGKFWSLLNKTTLAMPDDALVGLVMSATNNVLAGTVAFDHVSVIPGRFGLTSFPDSPFPESGIVLRDGSVIAGKVVQAMRPPTTQPTDAPNPINIRFQLGPVDAVLQRADDPLIHSIAAADVSSLLFNGAPLELASQLQSPDVVHGISLVTGDRFDGELEQVNGNQISFTSLMWGPHQFDPCAQGIAVVLNPVNHAVLSVGTPSPMTGPGWIVKTRDGSTFLSSSLAHTKDSIAVEVKGFGKFTVADADVIELRSADAR